MNNFKIALLQIMPGNNIEENKRIGEEACRKAKLLYADIALFPEMWSCGYNIPENVTELEELAASAHGEFVLAVATIINCIAAVASAVIATLSYLSPNVEFYKFDIKIE